MNQKPIYFFTFLTSAFIPFGLPAFPQPALHTYYVSPRGNDSSTGLRSNLAWKSLEKINHHHFLAGDKILLEGSEIFEGTIALDSLASGTAAHPVQFSSYGHGRAVIEAKDKTGFYGMNCSYITVNSIIFKGNGSSLNKSSGIHFHTNHMEQSCKGIRIVNCRVENFNQFGIYISCEEGEEIKGYDSVHIDHCDATGNGEAGIASYGGQTRFHHHNFYINDCRTFLNRGIVEKKDNHSGNGIMMGQVENLLIEYCEAFENGSRNRCSSGGPVGIWVWLCKNACIRYCESHHNHAGLNKDGGGFDIDGGSVDCTIEYNYSHDNEGAGYLLAEYGAGLPFSGNIIRFNISRDDGRKNGYGAVTIWGVDSNYKVKNSFIYNNNIYTSKKNTVDGIPCAVELMGPHLQGVLFANNIFLASGGAELIHSTDPVDSSSVRFISNDYYCSGGEPVFVWGKDRFTHFSYWQKKTGQELAFGKNRGLELPPGWSLESSGKSIHSTRSLARLQKGYHLAPGSALKNQGISPHSLGLKWPDQDFFGLGIRNQDTNFIGAAQ